MYPKNLTVKILDNGIIGSLYSEDIYEKPVDFVLTSKFQVGDVFKAKVKKVDVKSFKVELTKKPSDMKTSNSTLRDIVPNWDVSEFIQAIKDSFKVVESEDFQNLEEKLKTQQVYQPRKINHPNFKNMSMSAAIEFLQDKQVGDFVFRPSSR